MLDGTKWSAIAGTMLTGAMLAAATVPSTLTEADSGKTIPVKNGETVSVALSATLSAGYGWTLAKAAGITQQGQPTVSGGGGAGHMVGGAQTQTFRLKITGRGKHVATFNYARPWEHVAPTKTVKFTFTVR